MIIRAVTGALPTSGSTPISQDIEVTTGLGSDMNPKAAIFELTGSVTVNTQVAGRRHSIGVTDGTTQRSVGTMAENGQLSAAADSGWRSDNASVLVLPGLGSEALDGGVDWSAWITGGATVRTLDVFATAVQAKAVYFFGDDVECSVIEVTEDATEITGLGFAPNFAFAMSNPAGASWASNASGAPLLNHAFGYAVKTPAGGVQQVCYSEAINDRNAVSTNVAAMLRDDVLMQRIFFLATIPTVDTDTLSIASWDSDGVTFAAAAPPGVTLLLIQFKGNRKLYAGIRKFTESAGDVAVTDPGFKPAAYFAIATGLVEKNLLFTSSSTSEDGTAQPGAFSHGVYTGTESVAASEEAQDAVSPSETRSRMGDDAVFHVIDDAGGKLFAGTHVSLDPTGFTVNTSGTWTPGTTDPLVALVCIGSVDSGWLPEVVRRRHKTQTWGPGRS